MPVGGLVLRNGDKRWCGTTRLCTQLEWDIERDVVVLATILEL
jgi:hypothetical protein